MFPWRRLVRPVIGARLLVEVVWEGVVVRDGKVEEATHRIGIAVDMESVASVVTYASLVFVAYVGLHHVDGLAIDIDHPERMAVVTGVSGRVHRMQDTTAPAASPVLADAHRLVM